ncbi:indole-diterpene biosynthesis protein [Colletotrichum truncatum]|uniref:Indole-diterpene biosynthesis protein n=1 Tax=Colletotrichum truncatum TaxID=5467 RepID=A0ACC3ZKR4_COLTU|nr:indole-diterpene biosynthesis protein [Colletotrichum truncatum]KAF6800097.1 indole-diterpene biosynthesis protein [Colletotrichum truncatum]
MPDLKQLRGTVAKTEEFTPLSDQIYLFAAPTANTDDPVIEKRSQNGPDVVLIYGWGDGRLNHVAKYAAGYFSLFPRAKIIVILSQVFKGLFSSQVERVRCMKPLITDVFDFDFTKRTSKAQPSILVHVLSDTGGLYFTATLDGYKQAFGHAMPHSLLVMDSTPGSMGDDGRNIGKLADAMVNDAKATTPLPPQVLKAMCILVLFIMRLVEIARSRKNPMILSSATSNSEEFATKSARRLYMYSKEDLVTDWEAVEKHAADARVKGYHVECNLFEGSEHVQHMRRWPEKYWHIIKMAWAESTDGISTVKSRL